MDEDKVTSAQENPIEENRLTVLNLFLSIDGDGDGGGGGLSLRSKHFVQIERINDLKQHASVSLPS